MQSRRWWLLVVAALLSAGVSSSYAATATPLATSTSPDEGAKAAGDIVTRIIKGGTDAQKASDDLEVIAVANNTEATWLFKFMQSQVAPRFEQRIFDPAAGVPQNIQVVAIVGLVRTQGKMNIAAFDALFTKQLTNPNAAVRYWAAKGLVNMYLDKQMNSLGDAAKRSIYAALAVAATTETSTLAQAQMVRALGLVGDVSTVNAILEKNCNRFRYEAFSSTDAEAVVTELGAMENAVKVSPPKGKDLADAVKNVAWLADFAAQQAAIAKVNSLPDAKKIYDDALDIANAAVSALNATAKSNFPAISASDSLSLYDAVEKLTKKEIQALPDFKTIPTPPEVKLGGGPAPASAPATSAPAASAPAATSTQPK